MVVVVLRYKNEWMFTQEFKFLEVKEPMSLSLYLHHLYQWFSTRGNFVLQGQMAPIWQFLVTFSVVKTGGRGATGI